MNQNKIFFEWIGNELFRLISASGLMLNSLVLCLILIPSNDAFAQGSFVPSQESQSSYAQWNPPNPQSDSVSHASAVQIQSNESTGFSFPKSAVAFDPGVRTANLEVDSNSDVSGDSLESTIDSTATMLSNLKVATTEQLSNMAATLQQEGGWTEKIKSLFGSSDISRMLGSLTLVLGVYFAFVWVMRKINPAGNAGLPPEVIEVVGQVPFGPKRNLQLVRLGSKLLLLMNSPEGTQSIGEITDPNEVEYLASLCPGKRKTSSATRAAIQNAAPHASIASSAQATIQNPASQTTAPVPASQAQSNLANILRTLDQATRQNTALFEA